MIAAERFRYIDSEGEVIPSIDVLEEIFEPPTAEAVLRFLDVAARHVRAFHAVIRWLDIATGYVECPGGFPFEDRISGTIRPPSSRPAHVLSTHRLRILNKRSMLPADVPSCIQNAIGAIGIAPVCKLWFHATTHQSAQSIILTGAKPWMYGNDEADFGKALYLTADLHDCVLWAFNHCGTYPAVLIFEEPTCEDPVLRLRHSFVNNEEWQQVVQAHRGRSADLLHVVDAYHLHDALRGPQAYSTDRWHTAASRGIEQYAVRRPAEAVLWDRALLLAIFFEC